MFKQWMKTYKANVEIRKENREMLSKKIEQEYQAIETEFATNHDIYKQHIEEASYNGNNSLQAMSIKGKCHIFTKDYKNKEDRLHAIKKTERKYIKCLALKKFVKHTNKSGTFPARLVYNQHIEKWTEVDTYFVECSATFMWNFKHSLLFQKDKLL